MVMLFAMVVLVVPVLVLLFQETDIYIYRAAYTDRNLILEIEFHTSPSRNSNLYTLIKSLKYKLKRISTGYHICIHITKSRVGRVPSLNNESPIRYKQ